MHLNEDVTEISGAYHVGIGWVRDDGCLAQDLHCSTVETRASDVFPHEFAIRTANDNLQQVFGLNLEIDFGVLIERDLVGLDDFMDVVNCHVRV